MSTRGMPWFGGAGGSAILLGLTLGSASAAAAPQPTFSGRATVINATVAGQALVLSDTGPLPSSGGAQETSLLTVDVPELLTANVLHATAIGQGCESRSEASVADMRVSVGGNTVSADFLMARAATSCGPGGPSSSGGSEIANLVINGQPITVSGAPNQTIALPNGQVVINEQFGSQSRNAAELTVNALHITVTGVGEVVISSAHADIVCVGNACGPCQDFMTGGGWITGTPSGAKGTFGIAGGLKDERLWGHLTYLEHGRGGLKVKGIEVTTYTVVDDMTRRIEGRADVNGQGEVTYRVEVADRGEPGREDTLSLSLSNGYSASGTLGGGNLQLHQCR